ncbi:MAG TPA: wax ester/triacylglycerol synthase family O-acyltransferase [Parvibaculum sp.]|uniref:WS/DGAT/MGAT family O-acyltransferase n=1 Tax=Parvibaculum sp. TaxID=2024848 RepID=UPI002D1DC656|nr:wax ester/triacylglycerol synthase family O-acyltransferase [Parvibaculum sp.]HMM15290.1 wax ester/triacylglycerol synthase family O-acyltransferase [Parvibaculum sp.]
MEQLSPMDASFLYFETANAPMHIGAVAIYDQSTVEGGVLGFKEILKNYERRLHLARAFRQRVVRVPLNLDHPYWIEDPDFDLEYHVRHIALPKPGDWRQLCIQVARLHARPLDTARPLWEFTVIEGLDNVEGLPKGSFAIVSKVHHAAIDGVSGAEMTAAIHDLAPDATPAPPENPWLPEREPTAVELLSRTTVNNVRQPFKLARVVAESVPALARVGIGLTAGKLKRVGPVPRTRFNGQVSPHRVFDGRSFRLNDIRAIKNAVEGATVNDAVIAIIGGALRKYLEAKNELPKQSLIAMAPISVRSPDQKKSAGNQVSAMSVAVRSDIADPLERLVAVFESTTNSKEMTNAIGASTLTDYSQFIPSTVAGLAARLYTNLGIANRITPIFNTVITNIPGPQIPLYMTGARLVTQFGLGPILDGMGIIHPVFSYCGEITISFTSCREMLPDPAFYAACIEESFGELLAATKGKEVKTGAGARAGIARAAKPADVVTGGKAAAGEAKPAADAPEPKRAAVKKPARKKAAPKNPGKVNSANPAAPEASAPVEAAQ